MSSSRNYLPTNACREMPAFWPSEDATPKEMEVAYEAWSTPRQFQHLQEQLVGHTPVVREGLCGRLLAATLAVLPEPPRAQLDGLASKPHLNGVEVELLGQASAEGRVPVRVRSDGSEIRVNMARLRPPRENGKTEKWLHGRSAGKQKKKKERAAAGSGRKATELSLELEKRRDELLGRAESLDLEAHHLTDHMNYINTQAEKLQAQAIAIRKRFAIVQGLYKTTKDADKVLQLQAKEGNIRAQEAAYNANVEWLREEQAWLDEQPAMKAIRQKMIETMVQNADGRWVEKPPDPEDDNELSFEELLDQMKREQEGATPKRDAEASTAVVALS